MLIPLFAYWVIGVTSFTLLGSLYARRLGSSDLLVGLYVAFVLMSQILATKVASFDLGSMGLFTTSAGVLVFSVTFLLTDIVNERFGRKATQRMIFIALIAQMAMVFFLWLGAQFEPHPFWSEQGKYWDSLFVVVPQMTIASWVAFFISENIDAYIYAWFKERTHGKHLWLRNVISTIPALTIDSVLFVFIAYVGVSMELMLALIWGQLVLKWVVGLLNIPFMYLNYFILTHGKESLDRELWGKVMTE
ncbi:MAG: hypothetical protein A2845_02855 [Candidatus Lloydbacteria bacterium RIFCSPHIGHO2_01_FULL_49_22]|uniref:Probable queuosine precursor transporter n=1 Tax=Candidatus Lloydbacteria bacterium RIFCSPHIGHO2_01_FULL_49_22 TaxID=1798658 RepID=A0A1G2CVI1_9BACT|nr:MAG: hypothetical protein A2845_02855 [Candidatus Lloydbacteria bacterium RIFCSPHIGHO2_01_FULL_49_22]OGZ10384.1 MAG: hypothetical protein A3C14_02555 [Candidatus Lloydbacteria bacterium RIFCSPHIGHO2_02_FULL_50_18]